MRIVAALGAALLAGCSLAPDYAPPVSPAPSAYKEAGDWAPAAPSDSQPKGAWWSVFGDPTLDQLEGRLAEVNQTLAGAAARFAEARAEARFARAGLYPQLAGQGAATRNRRSLTTDPVENPAEYSNRILSVDASWEIDLWGRVRNTAAQGNAQADASAADLAAVELDLRAELASDYFALRGADAAQGVLDQTVDDDSKALALIRDRYAGGVAALADVAQAETQLESARTLVSDNRLKRAQLEHAIAILMGVPPADFGLAPMPLAGTPPAFAVGLPSTLLERRPDVAAAERRVFAANAGIGVARAAWFPVFDLGALVGVQSGSTPQWLRAPSSIWSVGPSMVLTVFDGGQRAAVSDEAHALYDEAVTTYRQTALTAWQEVEDGLSAVRQLEAEAKTQDAAVAAARRALEQARFRYAGGIVTYLEVVTSESILLGAQLQAVDILTRRMAAHVSLVKALGGGWRPAPADLT
jgi:NodT family efflux transporter outer membrane factor (OMF) lipoprotein